MTAEKGVCTIDRELLNQLYFKYSKEIYRYLYAMCQNQAVAQDLTQDTFLKALLSLSESHGNMKAWLYLVARNLYLNHQKKEKFHVPLDEHPQNTQAPGTLCQVIQEENNAQLFHAMNQLSRQKREILQLQYFGGFSQKEIAAMLRLTPGNVRVLALRAKRELKQHLEANDYDIS